MSDCLFCKIARGEIPAKLVHQDADTVAFVDINPQAPTHLLVIPRKHIPTVNDLAAEDEALMGKLVRVAAALAKERGIDGSGWRAIVNTHHDAGQTVFHVHLHLLGGRRMGWPPG
ncbi:histidine triad nucleotide-binding protein [Anaeromyxobacter sp. PSR-1]|uniref:histidine triad nucleotide-binding protein n=1 Tax=unclassified Anaeromyxobacter TaxID=2620896 RepID=UPI0005DBCF17|nr:histidine triad nucleotide-binding protein [Anaeromyxobacter sp. PSR-1]GAO04472.1 putative HIT-like protein aq_141 [Anaeromyxobacter sp. PSR-1]